MNILKEHFSLQYSSARIVFVSEWDEGVWFGLFSELFAVITWSFHTSKAEDMKNCLKYFSITMNTQRNDTPFREGLGDWGAMIHGGKSQCPFELIYLLLHDKGIQSLGSHYYCSWAHYTREETIFASLRTFPSLPMPSVFWMTGFFMSFCHAKSLDIFWSLLL